jgi:hypothetical protein
MTQPIDWEIATTAAEAGRNQSVTATASTRTQPKKFVCKVHVEVAVPSKHEADEIYGLNAIHTAVTQLATALFNHHPDGGADGGPFLVMKPRLLRAAKDGSFWAHLDIGFAESPAPSQHPTEKAARDMLKQMVGAQHNKGYVISVDGQLYLMVNHQQAIEAVPVQEA